MSRSAIAVRASRTPVTEGVVGARVDPARAVTDKAGTRRATQRARGPAAFDHTGAMERSTEIADFLRSRRAAIAPTQAGLPEDGRKRRVPGLRRDEVARLAGVSTEYYTRLEQGRAGNPSAEVLDALGRALQLDAVESEHLRDLLTRRAPVRRTPASPQLVRPGLYLMLQTLDHVPAFILGSSPSAAGGYQRVMSGPW